MFAIENYVGEDGFNAGLKPYQIEAIKYLWASPGESRSSREVWDARVSLIFTITKDL